MSHHIDSIARSYAELCKFSTVGIGGAMGVAIRRSLVREYIRKHLLEHGRLPNGQHDVRGDYKARTIRFKAQFPRKDVSALVIAGYHVTAKEGWGPPQLVLEDRFESASKQYSECGNEPLKRWLRSQITDALGSSRKRDE